MAEQTRALLVFDVQRGLFEKKIKVLREAELLDTINALMANASSSNVPVFVVRHDNDSFLKKGTEAWEYHPSLKVPAGAIHLEKQQGSAFAGTGLKDLLSQKGVTQVVVCGLVSQGCVRAACLDGMKLGFGVILAEDGHSNYNKDAASVIDEWNARLGQAGVEVIPAQEIGFKRWS